MSEHVRCRSKNTANVNAVNVILLLLNISMAVSKTDALFDSC